MAITIEGTVAQVNDSGLRLEAQQGWLNYTTQRPLPRAGKGDNVRLTVGADQEGNPKWINAIEVLGGNPTPSNNHNGGGLAERDVLNARMSALKSAARLAEHRDARSIDVLSVAVLYSRWILGTVTDDQVGQLAQRANGHQQPASEQEPIPF